MPASEDELIRRNKAHWRRFQDLESLDKLLEIMEEYIDRLLPLEMTWVNPESSKPEKDCKTLVLLVGYSLEPLLQAICYYKPRRVVLVLNELYGKDAGLVMGKYIRDLVREKLTQPSSRPALLEAMPAIEATVVKANPAQVFQALVDKLRDELPEDVIVDITGAKKSMVAGAFLYAAFADVAISYVEFGDKNYGFAIGRPMGYLSKIQQLTNPYDTFALREWTRVRTLYEEYRFRDVYDTLVGANGKVGKGTILSIAQEYQSKAIPAIIKLSNVLRCYIYWDSGDFNAAKKLMEEQPELSDFTPPSAVTQLGGSWFTVLGTTFSGTPPRFYDDTPMLRTYVYDELERVGRLIQYNQDYRSAFLRAAGVNEVLLVARLVRMVNASDKETLLLALNQTPTAHKLFEELLEPAHRRSVKELFERPPSSIKHIVITSTGPMNQWWSKTPFITQPGKQQFLEIRNKLAHTYVSIPEELACAGLDFARANFEDFVATTGDRIECLDINAKAMLWPELCRLCGLDQVLTPNLSR